MLFQAIFTLLNEWGKVFARIIQQKFFSDQGIYNIKNNGEKKLNIK